MDGNNITITNSSNTKSNFVIFEFSGNDTGGVGVDHLECSLDGASFTACTSPIQYTTPQITDGTHTFEVLSVDNSTNSDPSPAQLTWNVDTIPPTTNITKAMDGNNITITNSSDTKSNSVIFEFSGNDTGDVGVDHLECSLDGATFTTCTSPIQYTTPQITDGTHTFEVLSVDNSTNSDPSPAQLTWNVDTVPPETTILSASDGNQSTVTIGQNTSSKLMTIEFSGNDTGGVGVDHLECSLDGASFTACTSPIQYTTPQITDGTHTFEVLSVDNSTNSDPSPAQLTWNVDTIPPTTNITKAMDGNIITITNSSDTKSNSVIFEFSGNDTGGVGVDHLECSLDGASFTACTSPIQYTTPQITDGTHTFEVLSVDNSTNKDPSPAQLTWNVDTVPPETTILSASDGNQSTVTIGQNTSSKLMTIEFSGNDTGGVGVDHLECSLDGATFTACTSPIQYTTPQITDGTHTFEVLSVDNSTNSDPSPAQLTWNVDTIPPTTNITKAMDGNNITITNSSDTKSNSVIFEFSGNDTGDVGVDHLECSLDGATFTTCTSPIQYTTPQITDGTHTFEVLSVDNSTNSDPSPAQFTWNVDTVPPETTILSASDGNQSTVTIGQNTSSKLMTIVFSGNDTGGVGVDHLECSLDGASFTVCTSPIQYTTPQITDGTHTFEVLSVDNSTNSDPSPAQLTWNVDTIPPTTNNTKAMDGNIITITNSSDTKSNSVIFEFSGNDTGGVGVDHLECSLDGATFTTCTSPVQFSSADILDGTHAFSVRAQDKVGNIMSTPLLFNWTVDTVAPSTNINMAIDGNNETLVSNGS